MKTPPEITAAYLKATPRQRALALALGQGMFKGDAMVAAGYSKAQARKCDPVVTDHPLVVKLTSWYVSQAMAKHEVAVERVIEEMVDIALFDPALMYDAEGKMMAVKDWPEQARRAFAGFDSSGIPKFVSKTDAVEKLAKIKGWYAPERHVHTVNPLEKLIEEIQGNALKVVTHDPEQLH